MPANHRAARPFQSLSRRVVREFLQTAVVLDDEAFIRAQCDVVPLDEPDPVTDTLQTDTDDQARDEAQLRPGGNSLDAQSLINAFASNGMVCAVLKPQEDLDADDATIEVSRRADIVILDWHLGDQGERATRVIKRITADDADSQPRRLRLIAIYTAERDLSGICDDLANALPAFQKRDLAPSPSLVADHARVLFMAKGTTSEQVGIFEESDLPDRLIDEFAEIGQGLLANVAFGSIAAIRRDTHHLLARFHSGLDAPFVSHRILLETPDDAEQYALDLLSSELAVLLQDCDAGPRFAGKDAIRALLDELADGGRQLRLMRSNNVETDAQPLSVDDLMRLVEQGPAGLAGIPDREATKNQMNRLHHRVELLLSDNLDGGRATHREFARLSSSAREKSTISSKFRAKLDLGAVVRCGQSYLLCIQPRCDAVRLDDPTRFVFAPLKTSNSSFDLIVRDRGLDVSLKLDESAAKILHHTFEPDPDARTVLTTETGCFIDAGGQSLTWLCDLRDAIAQRFVQRIAASLSRIALDEFEWQRRHAKG